MWHKQLEKKHAKKDSSALKDLAVEWMAGSTRLGLVVVVSAHGNALSQVSLLTNSCIAAGKRREENASSVH